MGGIPGAADGAGTSAQAIVQLLAEREAADRKGDRRERLARRGSSGVSVIKSPGRWSRWNASEADAARRIT